MEFIIEIAQEISDLIKNMKALKKDQRRLQLIWIITFLTSVIPLTAFLGR